MNKNPLALCVEICGGQSALAEKVRAWHAERGEECRVQQAHVWNWLNKSDGVVPSEHVIAVAASGGFRITPHHLRADIYPHPHDGLPDHLRLAANDDRRHVADRRQGIA